MVRSTLGDYQLHAESLRAGLANGTGDPQDRPLHPPGVVCETATCESDADHCAVAQTISTTRVELTRPTAAAQSRRRQFTAFSPEICGYPALIPQTIHVLLARIRRRAASHSRSTARNMDLTAWRNARRRVSRVLYRRRAPATAPVGGDGHSSRTPVAERLVRPTRAAARRCARRPGPGTVRGRQRLPLLLGLAPGGVFRAVAVAGDAVRSYRTVSPLPPDRSPGRARRCAFCGTVPGVAPAGRYPAPYLRGARTFLSRASRRAAVRPSGERRCGRWRWHCQRPAAGVAAGRGRLDATELCEPDRSGELDFDVAAEQRIDQLGRVARQSQSTAVGQAI